MKLTAIGAIAFTVAYWAAVIALAILAAKFAPIPGGWGAPLVLALGVVPSAACRIVWRDHFRGQRLLREGDPAGAESAFRAFRERHAGSALVRSLEWLAVFRTTRVFESIIWNNIGVAQLEQNRPADALLSFELALHGDPAYQVARCNAFLAARAAGDVERFAAHREAAIAHGVSPKDADRIIAEFDTRRRMRAN